MKQSPHAFDAFSGAYDAEFSDTWLGRWLRRDVWDRLGQIFPAPSHLLELAGGTGIDAAWLTEQGHTLLYTDGSSAMTTVAEGRIIAAGQAANAECRQLSLQQISAGALGQEPQFDGVLANFGGLNTIGAWHPLASALAAIVRPRGRLALVLMGPVCPWEILWFGLHRDWARAGRRWRGPTATTIGETTIPVWYPSPTRLKRDFGPWFRLDSRHSLGLWLPPTYLAAPVGRRPRLRRVLTRLERATGRFGRGWGDHYMAVFTRVSDA